MNTVKDLNLPEFAFIEGWGGNSNDVLKGRNVVLHVRSASVIEMLPNEEILALRAGVLTYKFDYINKYAVVEHYTAVLHYCATLDEKADAEMIRNEIMAKAAKWFCDYMEWEDENIANDPLL